MSRFYGMVQGKRGGAARTATDPTHVNLNGWNCGVQVQPMDAEGKDAFVIYMTGGSNHASNMVQIGVVFDTADGPYFVPGDGS